MIWDEVRGKFVSSSAEVRLGDRRGLTTDAVRLIDEERYKRDAKKTRESVDAMQKTMAEFWSNRGGGSAA